MKTYSVKLRVFRGKKSYDKDKDDNLIVVSPNQLMHLYPYLSMEWNNWMKNATNVGFTDAEVVEVCDIVHTEHTKLDGKEVEPYITSKHVPVEKGDAIVDEIKAAVKSVFDTSVKVVLSPEQQKIADMEAEMAEMRKLLEGKTTTKKVVSNDNLADLKVKYEELFNKKPYHGWDETTLNEKIKAKLAE